MANRHYIRQQKQLYKELESTVPAVYASIAIVLHEGGITDDDILYIFSRSQQLWEDNRNDVEHMLVDCFNKTGVQVMSPKQYEWAVSQGLIEDEYREG